MVHLPAGVFEHYLYNFSNLLRDDTPYKLQVSPHPDTDNRNMGILKSIPQHHLSYYMTKDKQRFLGSW